MRVAYTRCPAPGLILGCSTPARRVGRHRRCLHVRASHGIPTPSSDAVKSPDFSEPVALRSNDSSGLSSFALTRSSTSRTRRFSSLTCLKKPFPLVSTYFRAKRKPKRVTLSGILGKRATARMRAIHFSMYRIDVAYPPSVHRIRWRPLPYLSRINDGSIEPLWPPCNSIWKIDVCVLP